MSAPGENPPAVDNRPPSLTITVLEGRYEVTWHALPKDPVILSGLLRVAEAIVMQQMAPKTSGLHLVNGGPMPKLPPLPMGVRR